MATKTASTTHLRKRQYQPSIAAYFSKTNDSAQAYPQAPSLAPILPPETQSMLLNVGMRVRKAVPEGYKTHKTPGLQFATRNEHKEYDGYNKNKTSRKIGEFDYLSIVSTAPSTMSLASESGRELTPFCGLHKIGGLAAQDSYIPASSAPAIPAHYSGPSYRDGNIFNDDEDSDSPSLSFSQTTVESTTCNLTDYSPLRRTNLGKRSYEEDVEAEMDAFFDEMGDENDIISAEQNLGSRRIAKPRGTKNGRSIPSGFAINDFEDAGFLAPLDGMDLDRGGPL